MNKKKDKTMAEITAKYETLMKDKKVKSTGKKAFDKAIKSASKPRSAK